MDRRTFMALSAAFGGIGMAHAKTPELGTGTPFSRALLVGRAQQVAQSAYTPRQSVPQAWQDLSYDEYRLFWFDEQKALWQDTDRPARVDFFLPGLYFVRPVQVHVVEDGIARTVAFDLSLFDRTDKAPGLAVDDSIGYSGFRLRGELAGPGIFQEYAVFQGASYFRAHARGQVYGL